MYYKQYDAKSAQMSGVHLFAAAYWLWSMSLALPRHRHNYFQCIFMIQNGKWFSNAECICVVCVEIDEIKKKRRKKKSRSVPHLLQAQQAPVLPYAKVVGRPPRHCKLPSTIARHENGFSTSSVKIIISVNKIIVISCRKTVFNCQFHPFITVSSFYLGFCVLKMKSRTS